LLVGVDLLPDRSEIVPEPRSWSGAAATGQRRVRAEEGCRARAEPPTGAPRCGVAGEEVTPTDEPLSYPRHAWIVDSDGLATGARLATARFAARWRSSMSSRSSPTTVRVGCGRRSVRERTPINATSRTGRSKLTRSGAPRPPAASASRGVRSAPRVQAAPSGCVPRSSRPSPVAERRLGRRAASRRPRDATPESAVTFHSDRDRGPVRALDGDADEFAREARPLHLRQADAVEADPPRGQAR
jgi:hypothetical protein